MCLCVHSCLQIYLCFFAYALFTIATQDLEAGASGNGAGGMGMPMPNLFGGLPTGPDANPFASAAAMAGAGSAASASAASPPSAGAGAGGGSLEEQLAQAVSGMQENLKSVRLYFVV